MKVFFLFPLLLSLITVNSSYANPGNGDGNHIEYLISHGKTIYGDTDINLEYDDVILRIGKDIIHYPSSQIEKIAVKEGPNDEIQLYYCGMFGLNEKRYLFKILSEGHLSLLFREGLKFSEYDEIEYPPFYVLIDKQIYALSTTKKELLKQMDERYQKELSTFIKSSQINLQSQADLIQLFDYYNSLIRAK